MVQDVKVTNVYRGKKLQIYGVLLGVIGFCLMVGTWPANVNESFVGFGLSALMIIVGGILATAGKGQHWYHAE